MKARRRLPQRPGHAAGVVAVAMALLCSGAAVSQPPGQGATTAPRVGIEITPETVTVGQPFDALVRLRALRSTGLEFPAAPDSSVDVELRDPRALVADASDSTFLDVTSRYRMIAWGPGTQAIRVRISASQAVRGAPRRAPIVATATVFVRSVLPADSTQRVPKPARDVVANVPPWWWPWLPILLAAALAGGLIWWGWRRRTRGRMVAVPDPLDVAEREFARIEALGLINGGERARHVALMMEVLRAYLAARLTVAHPSLTSTELVVALRPSAEIPVDRLSQMLSEADLVKFARRPLTADRALALGSEARAIVRVIARPPAAPALAEAA